MTAQESFSRLKNSSFWYKALCIFLLINVFMSFCFDPNLTYGNIPVRFLRLAFYAAIAFAIYKTSDMKKTSSRVIVGFSIVALLFYFIIIIKSLV